MILSLESWKHIANDYGRSKHTGGLLRDEGAAQEDCSYLGKKDPQVQGWECGLMGQS